MPVLAAGDEIGLAGRAQRVVALDGTSVRLVDVAGAVTVMLTGHLLADPSFELLTGHGRPLPAAGLSDLCPGEVRARAQWWGVTSSRFSPGSRRIRRREASRTRMMTWRAAGCGSGSWPSTPP